MALVTFIILYFIKFIFNLLYLRGHGRDNISSFYLQAFLYFSS